jgi:TRAP-type C4-dicarboxylate transport system permease large subunit
MMRDFAETIGSPLLLFTIFVVMYLILGMFFDGISMTVITMPFVLPALTVAGMDTLWFGSILIILIGIAALTPPVGLNLFVLQGVTGVELFEVIRGSLPYMIILLSSLYIMYAFPQIALWLPNTMG